MVVLKKTARRRLRPKPRMFPEDRCLYPAMQKVSVKELGRRLNEIRCEKPEPMEKLITKDTYKKFDTMGVVERFLNFLQGMTCWTCSKVHKVKHGRSCVAESSEMVMYFPAQSSKEDIR